MKCAHVLAGLLILGCGSEDGGSANAGGSGSGGSGNATGGGAGSAGSGGGNGGSGGSATGGSGGSAGSSGSGGVAGGSGSPALDAACPDLGWCELSNTKLASVCADPADGCGAVIAAWNSGVADLPRNRLLFWGGGHGDYFGNEIYSLDLNELTLTRQTEPSPEQGCVEALSDGKPNSRHTYDGLVYLGDVDRIYMFGGALACSSGGAEGIISRGTWTLDPTSFEWQRKDPLVSGPAAEPSCCNYIPASDWDPVSKRVLTLVESTLWSYDLGQNAYEKLDATNGVDYHETAVVDREHQLYVVVGGGQLWTYDLSDPSATLEDWSNDVTGCNALLDAAYPGLAYDHEQKLIVGWSGGDSVYLFDASTKSCSEVTFPNGPGPAQVNGTFKRFSYFPSLRAFALVNDWEQNAFVLRLSAP